MAIRDSSTRKEILVIKMLKKKQQKKNSVFRISIGPIFPDCARKVWRSLLDHRRATCPKECTGFLERRGGVQLLLWAEGAWTTLGPVLLLLGGLEGWLSTSAWRDLFWSMTSCHMHSSLVNSNTLIQAMVYLLQGSGSTYALSWVMHRIFMHRRTPILLIPTCFTTKLFMSLHVFGFVLQNRKS